MNIGKHSYEVRGISRGCILLEIILVLAPTQLCLFLGYRPEHDSILISKTLTLLGGPSVYIGMISTLLMFIFAKRFRGEDWKTYGLSRPSSWFRTGLTGLGLAILMIGSIVVIQELISFIFPNSSLPGMNRLGILHHHFPNLMLNIVVIWFTTGLVEELIWRGYLMSRLANFFVRSKLGWVATLVCSAALFGLTHFYQGPLGMLLSGITGFLFGVAYLVVRWNLWPLVIAHGLINTISFINIYLNGI